MVGWVFTFSVIKQLGVEYTIKSESFAHLCSIKGTFFSTYAFQWQPCIFDPWERVQEMRKDHESLKISCFTLLWFSKQFKQIELTSKSIYIVVGLFTSSRNNISFNCKQFLKNSQAVPPGLVAQVVPGSSSNR